MALTLCTINSKSLQKIGGQVIGTDNINLTITPDEHHSVTASDFTVGTLPTGVDSITITDNGVAGSFANTLNVLVNLTDDFEMPSSNTTITVDVDGAAIKGERILQDIFLLDKEPIKSSTQATVTTTAGTGITVSSQSTVSSNYERNVTGSKPQGERVLLFTKTFSAATGYYYATEPDYDITSAIREHPELYDVEVNRTYLDDGSVNLPLQVIEFKVYYTVPSYDVVVGDMDTITFSAETFQLFSPGRKITNVTFDSSNIGQRGGNKFINVYGVPGAAYNLNIGSNDTHIAVVPTSYLNQVIPAKGYQSHEFVFGSSYVGNTYTNITYNLSISAASSTPATTIDYTNIPNSTPNYTLSQTAPVTLILNRTGLSNFTLGTPSSVAVVAMPGYQTEDIDVNGLTTFDYNFTVAKPSGGNVMLRRQPLYNEDDQSLSDFSDSVVASNTGYVLNLEKLEVTGAGTATASVKVKGDADFGTVNKTMTLNLDNIINTPPVAYAQSNVNIANNTATNIALTGTDANNDTLTYTITSQGSKGTAVVNQSTGACVYTPTSTLHTGSDQFSYKVSDIYEDSNIAAISVVIAGSGSNTPTFNSVWSWEDTEDGSSSPSIIGNSSFQGTPLYSSASSGASSFTAIFTSWALDSTHVGFPSYVDNFGDITIRYYFKYGSTTLATDVVNINQGTSSFNQSAQTGTINVTSSTITVPNSHNSGNGLIAGGGYTFEWRIEYDNISQ